MTPLALSVAEVAERLNVSRSEVYKAVRSGDIPSVRLGRRYLIPVSRLEEWLAQ